MKLRVYGWRAVTIAVLGAGALIVPVLALAAAGGTGHTVTVTEHEHGSFFEPEANNPCTGTGGGAWFDGNLVSHVTFFPGGDEVWATFTETGKVTATFDGVNFSGHATAWGNFNRNAQNTNNTLPSRST